MPSPAGHSLVGYLVARQVFGKDHFRHHRTAICILISILPDFDFIPGALSGQPNRYHHAVSHSLGACLLASGILALMLSAKLRMRIWTCFALFFGLYGSHLFLDYLSMDGRPPYGIPVFWPLSNRYFIAPHPILPGIAHSGLDHATIGQFLTSAISMYNLHVILFESGTVLLLLSLFYLSGRLFKRRQ